MWFSFSEGSRQPLRCKRWLWPSLLPRDEVRNPDGTFVEMDRGVGHVADFRADDAAPVLGPRQQLFVSVRASDVPGVSEWFAPAECRGLGAMLGRYRRGGTPGKGQDLTRAIAQCRAEALADLILGRAEVTANVVIPVPVFAGTTGAEAERPGAR